MEIGSCVEWKSVTLLGFRISWNIRTISTMAEKGHPLLTSNFHSTLLISTLHFRLAPCRLPTSTLAWTRKNDTSRHPVIDERE